MLQRKNQQGLLLDTAKDQQPTMERREQDTEEEEHHLNTRVATFLSC